MSRIYIPLVVFLLLVIEGSVFQLITIQSANITLVPRFVLVIIVLIAIHMGRYAGISYGIIFGLIYDITYTQFLGVYSFGLAFVGYFFAVHYKRVQDSILIQIVILIVAIVFYDSYQYGLFRLIGVTDMQIEPFLYVRILPSLVLNIAFAIIIYYPLKKLLEYVKKQKSLRE